LSFLPRHSGPRTNQQTRHSRRRAFWTPRKAQL
jgi:hypothetical protein